MINQCLLVLLRFNDAIYDVGIYMLVIVAFGT
jgi:hypothetical protein